MQSNPEELTKEEQTWLDLIHTSRARLMGLSYDIEHLSLNFFKTGNDIIGTKLSLYALEIEEALEEIDKAVGMKLSHTVKHAQEMSAQMLNLVLNCDITKKGK